MARRRLTGVMGWLKVSRSCQRVVRATGWVGAAGQEILESDTLCGAAKDGGVLQAGSVQPATAIVPAYKVPCLARSVVTGT